MWRPIINSALRVVKYPAPELTKCNSIKGWSLFSERAPLNRGFQYPVTRNFSINRPSLIITPLPALLSNTSLTAPVVQPTYLPVRNVTKFSLNKGKRKSVKTVLRRFKRLHWGGWIRTICGRQKKLFKKSARRRWRLRQHVLVNSTQSWLLDKMVTNFWRKPKYWIDDPYAPYHRRDEFFATKRSSFKV